MPKYRKRALVEAVQLTDAVTVATKTGEQTGKPGDYLITNPDGEQYPCPKDVFEDTYELAES